MSRTEHACMHVTCTLLSSPKTAKIFAYACIRIRAYGWTILFLSHLWPRLLSLLDLIYHAVTPFAL